MRAAVAQLVEHHAVTVRRIPACRRYVVVPGSSPGGGAPNFSDEAFHRRVPTLIGSANSQGMHTQVAAWAASGSERAEPSCIGSSPGGGFHVVSYFGAGVSLPGRNRKAPGGSTAATRCALRSRCSLQCLRRLARQATGPFQSRPTAPQPRTSPADSVVRVAHSLIPHTAAVGAPSRRSGRTTARAEHRSFRSNRQCSVQRMASSVSSTSNRTGSVAGTPSVSA